MKDEFYLAIKNSDLKLIKDLVRKKEQANYLFNKEYSVLLLASMVSNLDVVKFLVTKGADVHFRNKMGITPLMQALYYENADIAEFLIDEGADVNSFDENGNSVLAICVLYHKKLNRIIKKIIPHTKLVDSIDKQGKTPLMQASKHSSKEIGELLILQGADVDLRDNSGDSSLNIATLYHNYEFIDLLCKYGAKHFKGTNGLFPYEYAQRLGDVAMQKMFYRNHYTF